MANGAKEIQTHPHIFVRSLTHHTSVEVVLALLGLRREVLERIEDALLLHGWNEREFQVSMARAFVHS